ncbi:MAG: hypothetical protein ACI4MI_04615 [Christensenellales bacterium]
MQTKGEKENVEKIFVQDEMDVEVGSMTTSDLSGQISPDNTSAIQQSQSADGDLQQAVEPTHDYDDIQAQPICAQENDEGGEKPDTYNEKSDCGQDNEDKLPLYQSPDWKTKTDKFFEEYPSAKRWAEQIGRTIADDNQLARNENCLEIALARVLSDNYLTPQEMIQNRDFVEQYVLTNEQIKSKIIDEYIQSLEQNRPPKSMMGRGQIILSPPNKPKSIEEAGEIIKKMLVNRRI